MLGLENNELQRARKETVTGQNHAGFENRRWEVLTLCQGQPAEMCSMHQQRRAPEQGTMLPDYTAS
jgi:hypothetical protein